MHAVQRLSCLLTSLYRAEKVILTLIVPGVPGECHNSIAGVGAILGTVQLHEFGCRENLCIVACRIFVPFNLL
jgi:hypothetical protein